MNPNNTNFQNPQTQTESVQKAQDLGARIRQLRTERGLSQEALAEALDVSRQAVAKWERGASLPSTANLLALSRISGVPLSELTGMPQEAEQAPAEQSASAGQDTMPDPCKGPSRPAVVVGAVVLLLAGIVCLAAAVGVLLICFIRPAAPEGVIGYADGPTSIWVAGPDISGVLFCIAALILGIAFLVCAVLLWRKRR